MDGGVALNRKISTWIGVALVVILAALTAPHRVAAQESTPEPQETPAVEEPAVSEGPVKVARIGHVNHSLVLFDEYDRRYVLADGHYTSEHDALLVIEDGRIHRMVGCGAEPCDFTTYSTRIVDRSLLLFAELATPDGKYRREGGGWFLIEDGELTEYSQTGD